MLGLRFLHFAFPRQVVAWVGARPKTAAAMIAFLLTAVSVGSWVGFISVRDFSLEAARADFQSDLLQSADNHLAVYLQHRPEDHEARFLASRIARLRGRFFDAEKHLNECKRLGGGEDVQDRIQLEWVLLRSMGGEYDTFAAGLMKCLESKHPQTTLVLEALAFCCMKSLNYLTAVAYLEMWLKREPDNVRALHWRGWVRENLEYLQGAREDYERALALSPQHWRTRVQLTLILFGEKRVPEAVTHLKMLERDKPDDPQVMYALALGREAQGRPEEAKNLLDALLVREPVNARALHRRGVLEPHPAEKERWFRKALALDGSFYEAHFSLYSALLQQGGRAREAAAELKAYNKTVERWTSLRQTLRALAKRPQDPDLLAKVGELILTRNPALGREFLYNALRITPDHRRANEVLAQFFEAKKQFDKAARHRKILAQLP